jgi:hypothetical protein
MTKEEYTALRRTVGSQVAVAVALGISKGALCKRETGVNAISRESELALLWLAAAKSFGDASGEAAGTGGTGGTG